MGLALCVSRRNQTHARLSLNVHDNSVGTATKTPNEDYRIDLIEAFVASIQRQLHDSYLLTEFDLFCIIPSSINRLLLSYLSRYQVYGIRSGTIYSINKHALLPLFHEIRFCQKLLPSADFLTCGSSNHLIVRTLHNDIYSIDSDKYQDATLTANQHHHHQKQRAYLTQLSPFQSIAMMSSSPSTETTHANFIKEYADSLRRKIEFIANGHHNADDHRTYYKLSNGEIYCATLLSSTCKLQPIQFTKHQRENITQIELGEQHTLFLSDTGRVYATGKNHRGQLGVSVRHKYAKTPVLVDSFSGCRRKRQRTRIRSISAGRHHSLCVDEADNVYMFGCNQHRQCQLKQSSEHVSKGKVCSYFDEPVRLAADESMNSNLLNEYDTHCNAGAVKAKCGAKSTVILYHDGHLALMGDLSVWRKNIVEQLELQSVQIRDFDVGMNHIVFVCARGEMYSFGLYDKTNVYRLQRDMFPNIDRDSTVHSVMAAPNNIIAIFH